MANRAAGKGYENEAFYENIKFHFLGIENIHVMRTSLQKLVESKQFNSFRQTKDKILTINFIHSSNFYRSKIIDNERLFKFA